MTDYSISRVRLSCIDSADQTCRITTETGIGALARSIDTVGLISPPLLIKSTEIRPRDSKCFTIVCGFRRIWACRKLGWSDVEARLLSPDTKPLECISLAITDNAFQRSLNLIEVSRSFHQLSGFFNDRSDLAKAAAALGLPENPCLIRKISKLCALPQVIQDGILSNTISLPIALELGSLEGDSGIALAELFESLRLSLSKQREIITLVREIALREERSILEVSQGDDVRQILDNEDFDRNQKTRELRSYLKQRRFPAITHAQKMFERHAKSLGLGNNAKLVPPPNFEGLAYSLNLRFRNFEELQEHRATLDNVIGHPSLKKMIKD